MKTDAPNEFVWDILKTWIKTKPIKEKWLTKEFKVYNIINKPIQNEVNLTIR
jgi:hypothetical protein